MRIIISSHFLNHLLFWSLVLQRLWRQLWGQPWLVSLCSACVRKAMPSSWLRLERSSRRRRTWRKVNYLLPFRVYESVCDSSTSLLTLSIFPPQVLLFLPVCQLTTVYAIALLWKVTLMSYSRTGTLSRCKLFSLYPSHMCTSLIIVRIQQYTLYLTRFFVCSDLGVHVDGFISNVAHTFAVGVTKVCSHCRVACQTTA